MHQWILKKANEERKQYICKLCGCYKYTISDYTYYAEKEVPLDILHLFIAFCGPDEYTIVEEPNCNEMIIKQVLE